jgi:hypothetical protein
VATYDVVVTNHWIAQDLIRYREEELRRAADAARRATPAAATSAPPQPGRAQSGHAFTRHVGQLLVRAGVRLGAEPALAYDTRRWSHRPS